MKKLITLVCLCSALMSWGWGQKGHDVTAYVAEQHLTPEAKAAVNDLLDGKSMVYWANWLDNASHTPEYAYTKTWHYKNINEGVEYEKMGLNSSGDVVTAIKSRIEILKDPSKSKDEKTLALKMLVHIMGDVHQPMHMGHATDLGGNRVKIKYFNRDKNLHGIWDTDLVESAHKWSYSEWQQQIDRPATYDMAAAVAGNIDDWARASMLLAREQYVYFQPGTKASYNHIARWTTTIERQFLLGGLRLAHVLNIIFDADYRAHHSAEL